MSTTTPCGAALMGGLLLYVEAYVRGISENLRNQLDQECELTHVERQEVATALE